MLIQYTLNYGSGILTVTGGDFYEALDEMNGRLGTSYTEKQVRIQSAVRLK